MDWLALVSAFGLGALLSKVVDTLWLNKVTNKMQHKAWLRDQRLEAFTEAGKELITFGLHSPGAIRTPFESYAAVTKAMLLVSDESLMKRIDQFIVKMQRMNDIFDNKPAETEVAGAMYEELVDEAREIVKSLRHQIVNGPNL